MLTGGAILRGSRNRIGGTTGTCVLSVSPSASAGHSEVEIRGLTGRIQQEDW